MEPFLHMGRQALARHTLWKGMTMFTLTRIQGIIVLREVIPH
jgi:hypothetical protein